MNQEQFKFRTSALHLPKDVHDLYDQVVQSCETCQKNKVGSTRSKVSGLRSEVFGEMTFIDHCDVVTPTNEKIVMFIILDGATTLLTAYPVKTKTDVESLKLFKEYVSTYHIQPKYVVGDGAFMGPDWEQYYQHFDIRPITLGAMTPWPNRAETAVRLFKRQVSLMLRAIQERTVHKTLAVTYRDLLSAAALARNLSVTCGGVCPLELAFGRRPAELIQLDTALPNQLGEPTVEDFTAQQLRDLSRKTYIEARQSEDIRRDLAGKLRLSSKPILR